MALESSVGFSQIVVIIEALQKHYQIDHLVVVVPSIFTALPTVGFYYEWLLPTTGSLYLEVKKTSLCGLFNGMCGCALGIYLNRIMHSIFGGMAAAYY